MTPNWRVLAAGAALACYAVLSWLLMTYAPDAPWTVAALFGPLLLALAWGGVVRRHLPTLLASAAGALALVGVALWGVDLGIERLYVLQHAAIHLALAWTFAMTLRPGSTPLITQMAERIHDSFTPAMRAYTGELTRVWVVYFVAMVVVSLTLYALTPWAWWSAFSNIVTPLAALSLFVGEHRLRYHRHPEFERVTLAQVLRAYRNACGPAAGGRVAP